MVDDRTLRPNLRSFYTTVQSSITNSLWATNLFINKRFKHRDTDANHSEYLVYKSRALCGDMGLALYLYSYTNKNSEEESSLGSASKLGDGHNSELFYSGRDSTLYLCVNAIDSGSCNGFERF